MKKNSTKILLSKIAVMYTYENPKFLFPFSISCSFIFSLINVLLFVCTDHGIHWGKYLKNSTIRNANFETFSWNFSLSINLFFLNTAQQELEDTEFIHLVKDKMINTSSVTYIDNADIELLMPIQDADLSVQ